MWAFEIVETSNGAYSCVGKRTIGNKVSISCGEDEIYRVYEEAYKLEVGLGTFPTEALFHVVSGSRPHWVSKYEKEIFGSWYVQHPTDSKRFVYDGRDFILMAYENDETPSWQGRFKAGEELDHEFFKKLVC